MHFASFVINLLGWTFIGIGLGFFLHKGVRRRQNISSLVGGLASLIGGIFSFLLHGMWTEIGVDFFNLFVAFAFSLTALYIFAPNTRPSIITAGVEAFEKLKNLTAEFKKAKSQYFSSEFWKSISSTLG